MKLSILICTINNRNINLILEQLNPQLTDEVELLYLGDNKKRTTGEKRNNLITLAKGDYVVFIDDDDRITDDYVKSLLEATQGGLDCIVFDLAYFFNGKFIQKAKSGIEFDNDYDFTGIFLRRPNHIMCIKREIASEVKFLGINLGEDFDWAFKLKDKLRTQTRINKVLYFYYDDKRVKS